MAVVTRASLVRGASLNTFAGAKMFSKNDFNVLIEQETMNIETSPHGKVDERVINEKVEVSFTPEGRWDAATIAALWPYANTAAGASIFTAADRPLVMSAADGAVHTVPAAAVTKMPTIFLSASKTLVGPVTFSGVLKNNALWTDAAARYSVGTGGSVVDATFASNLIKVQGYVGAWGTIAGFTGFDTEDGWTIDFNLTLKPQSTDSLGIVDYTFVELSVMAKCVPIGPTSAQIEAAMILQGTGSRRGRSMNDDGSGSGISPNLVITGEDGVAYFTMSAASIKSAGFRFGASVLRQGEIGWIATRDFTTGAQQPLFVLAAS